MKRLFVTMVTLAAFALSQADSLKGKPAPDFKLKTPEGKEVTLKAFKGKPVLINFYSEF
mgnify:CR=1 FL=1